MLNSRDADLRRNSRHINAMPVTNRGGRIASSIGPRNGAARADPREINPLRIDLGNQRS